MANVFVVQSHCFCLMLTADRLPGPGETLTGSGFSIGHGGKGTGQAIAAGFFDDIHVKVIGRVGDDDEGMLNRDMLEQAGIGAEYVVRDKAAPTGRSAVFRDSNARNAIIVCQGAAANYCAADFEKARDYVSTCAAGGFQYEVNPRGVNDSIRLASGWGVTTVLDPAPVPDDFDASIYPCLNYIKPNEYEASLLCGIEVTDFDSAAAAGRWFLDRGVRDAAVITMGGKGSVSVTRAGAQFFPAPRVDAVDSTGAGDCFAGAFLAGVAAGRSLFDVMVDANCMGAAMAAHEIADTRDIYKPWFRAEFARIREEYLKELSRA